MNALTVQPGTAAALGPGQFAMDACRRHPQHQLALAQQGNLRGEERRIAHEGLGGINRSTDVLSFPAGEADETNLGDIAISIETATKQARENDLTFEQEVAQLILHGLLHLSGYDHETDNGEMNRLELKLRKRLGI
jgi:probable rRNA maturation factor